MKDKTFGRRVLISTAAPGVAGAALLIGSEATAAPPKPSQGIAKQLLPGKPSAATIDKISAEVQSVLDKSTNLKPAQAKLVIGKIRAVLPNLGDLTSGHLAILVSQHGTANGIATCTGGHLCDGHDSTPGDGPDCGVEACDVETCTDGHSCDAQSCGTEACDGGHECTGEYKGFVDIAGFSATGRSTWTKLQKEIDALEKAKQLEVDVEVEA